MATYPTSHKGGQPRTFVTGPDGQTVYGLSLHCKGRYYAIHKGGKREYFGRDLTEAIFRFRQWEAQQGNVPTGMYGQPIAILPPAKTETEKAQRQQAAKQQHEAFGKLGYLTWGQVRQLLLTDPEAFQQKTGLRVKVLNKPQDEMR